MHLIWDIGIVAKQRTAALDGLSLLLAREEKSWKLPVQRFLQRCKFIALPVKSMFRLFAFLKITKSQCRICVNAQNLNPINNAMPKTDKVLASSLKWPNKKIKADFKKRAKQCNQSVSGRLRTLVEKDLFEAGIK